MKIYTRRGDDGRTSLYGNHQVAKDEIRLAAFGTIDELNAVLGMVRAEGLSSRCDEIVARLQNQLFELGAELATLDPVEAGTALLQAEEVIEQEAIIDELDEQLPALTSFILPGGTKAAAAMHLARNVCRRAEREIVRLSQEAEIRPLVLHFMNRTSDLLFVLARKINAEANVADVPWVKTR